MSFRLVRDAGHRSKCCQEHDCEAQNEPALSPGPGVRLCRRLTFAAVQHSRGRLMWDSRISKWLQALPHLRTRYQPVEGIAIPSNESQECRVHNCVDQLNAGRIPVLAQRCAEGEHQDEQGAADKCRHCPETNEEERPQNSLHPGESESEHVHGPGRQQRILKHRNQRVGKLRRPRRDPGYTVHADVEPEGEPQEQEGEGRTEPPWFLRGVHILLQ